MPSGQPPSSNSIIVGNCIACDGLVRVSAKAKANANVRCPHCQQTFSLTQLLESAVPEVEVIQPETPVSASTPVSVSTPVSAPTTTQEKKDLYIDRDVETIKDSAGKFVVPSQLAKGARRRKSSRRGGSSRSSHRSESDSSSRDGRSRDSDHRSADREAVREARPTDDPRNDSGAERQMRESSRFSDDSSGGHENNSHRSTRHRDKRAIEANDSVPSAVLTVLKVFAGGALAMPIAYLIVMWVFSRDPLGIGRQIGDNVPFVVPASLRVETEEISDSQSSDSANFDDDPLSGFGDLGIGSEALQGMDP